MPRGYAKLFECLLCTDKFSLTDADKGRYFIETAICRDCYEKMQRSSAEVSCFGKMPTTKTFGYSRKHVVCRMLCPDKNICSQFVKIKLERI